MILEQVLAEITCKDLRDLHYSESMLYGDWELYHYTEDECIVLNDLNGNEIIQILFDYDTSDITYEVLNEVLFKHYMSPQEWI